MTDPFAPPATPEPTRVRYLIVAVGTLMAVMLYLHRTFLSVAEKTIADDLGVNTQRMGLLLSAFFWAYALAQVPSGWLGDRFGVRATLSVYILLWSVLTGLLGAAAGLAALIGLRLGTGLAQAGAYPASASFLSRWMPFAERGLGSAVVSVGGRIGGAVAPILTAFLLPAVGWRAMVAVYGAAGVGVAALFWACFRDRPRQHPRVNAAEADLIEASASRAAGPARGLPLRAMLVSPSLWLISFSQFTTNFGWVFLVSWMPRYLEEVCGVTDVRTRGLLTSIPLAVAIPAMLAGGWTTDRLTRRVGLRWGRSLPWALTRFAAMAALLACLFTRSPWVTTAALAVMSMSVDLGVASVWAYKQDVGGKYVGSILGWGNMWGNFGAAVSPIALEWLFRGSGWDAAFLACASAFLLSGLSSLGVDARVPVVPREDTAPAPPPKTP